MPRQEVQIVVARLQGDVAGYAVLRLESNKVAYLRNAMTVPAFRNRGVYLSDVKRRMKKLLSQMLSKLWSIQAPIDQQIRTFWMTRMAKDTDFGVLHDETRSHFQLA
jgi:hypothetical protein